MKPERVRKLVEGFRGKKIMVVGDLMLDEYVFGRVDRISPEAPVPVVHIRRRVFSPGGAANVANNIISLGGEVVLVGLTGSGANGEKLRQELEVRGINTSCLVADASRPTITKQRILSGAQQIVRIDTEEVFPPDDAVQERIEKIISDNADIDAVIISDYDKGLISSRLISHLVQLSREKGIPVTVDPHITHFFMYQNVTVLTPNQNELERALGTKFHSEEDVLEAGVEALRRLNSDHFIVTRGEEGMTVFSRDSEPSHIPTFAREVFDVVGAGDTVISALTLCLSQGLDIVLAAQLANLAAGVVVGKRGTATVTAEELIEYAGRVNS